MNEHKVANATFAVAHLSDFHLSSNAADSPVLGRRDAIVRAIAARCEEIGAGCLLVAATGDIAFSGLADEYVHATALLNDICSLLRSRLSISVQCLAVPGNHDCDTTASNSVRRTLLENLSSKADKNYVEACLGPQSNYNEFSKQLAPDEPVQRQNALLSSRELIAGEKRVYVCLYNTSWCSSKHEQQGSLYFPVDFLVDPPNHYDLVVSMFHHPYNWLESNNARDFRNHVERTSDVILSGHEHVVGRYAKAHASGTSVEYVEGGVLQDLKAPDHSEFNFVAIDLVRATQTASVLSWNPKESRYVVSAEFPPTGFRRNQIALHSQFPIERALREETLDPIQPYEHPRRKVIRLADVFIYPFLKPAPGFGKPDSGLPHFPLEVVLRCRKVLITGGDLAGKSSLSAALFLDLHGKGYIPVLLDGERLLQCERSGVVDIVKAAAAEAYGESAVERYMQLDKNKKVVLVDDLGRSCLNLSACNELVENLEALFDHVVITASDDFGLSLLGTIPSGGNRILEYEIFEIQAFGHRLRYDLVSKWCYLGVRATESEEELSKKTRLLSETLTQALGKNLLPSHPPLVLMCLQQLEGISAGTSVGSLGHLYEALVTQYLGKGIGGRPAKVDADAKRRFLSIFANHLFENQQDSVGLEDFEESIDGYLTSYGVSYSREALKKELFESTLVVQRRGEVMFRFRYGYCFFVAEHLRNNLDAPATNDVVKNFCQNMTQEDSAHILLLLAHLARSELVPRILLEESRKLFAEQEPIHLHDAVRPLLSSSFISQLQLDGRDSESHRREELQHRDQQKQIDENQLPPAVREFIAALKTVQVMGQILRSFPGSLGADFKLGLLRECYSLGVRSAGGLVSLIVSEHSAIVDEVADLILVHRSELKKDLVKVKEAVRQFLVVLCEATFYHAVLNVSDAVGLPALKPTYRKLLEENNNVPYRFIDIAVRLDHLEFPRNELQKLHDEVAKQVPVRNVLRRLVWRHLYLYPVSYQLRQSLCEKFDIKVTPMIVTTSISDVTKRIQAPTKTRKTKRKAP